MLHFYFQSNKVVSEIIQGNRFIFLIEVIIRNYKILQLPLKKKTLLLRTQ